MALKLKELRSDFSALLSLVPGVQECRIDELLGALDPQRIQQVVSPSDDSASPPNWEEVLVLLKTYEEALRINLRQLTTNPSLPLVRAISVILNQFPMAPELALKMSFSIEKQWVTLNALEGSLKGERRPNLIEGSSHPLREQQLTALKRVFSVSRDAMARIVQEMCDSRREYLALRDEIFRTHCTLVCGPRETPTYE